MLIDSILISVLVTGMAFIGVSTVSADPIRNGVGSSHVSETKPSKSSDDKFLFIGNDMDGDAQYLVVTAQDLED